MFNRYANLESFNDVAKHIDIPAIANEILDNPEDYEIKLTECFTIDGIIYEGTEEEAKEQFDEYKEEIESENEELENGEEKTDILTFAEWVKENITEIN